MDDPKERRPVPADPSEQRDTVTLYLHGLPSQRIAKRLLRVVDGRAIVDGFVSLEEHYRLTDGRRVRNDGTPEPRDFWRLSGDDCARLRINALGTKEG